MSFLDTVHAKRLKLANVLADEDYSGIRAIVEELYPDKAHFLFELLQNAEDAGATEAFFDLRPDGLTFEHEGGRPFEERDVWGITNIGKGTKRDEEDKIGRFGVGFKAVFAYSETPHVRSPTFNFKITDLVLPTELPPCPGLGGKTRFDFPFNNPKKAPADAYAEVWDGLKNLAETTLLFLTHLQAIHWRVGGEATGRVFRIQHSEAHVEVARESGGKTTGSSHFLKFERPVEGLEKQRIAIAYALDFLPNVTRFDPEVALKKQLRVIPAAHGRVAVFFPAEKEVSGLRFHLHAPFVPELSRASIKETDANLPLFEQLVGLSAATLHDVRELGLLTLDFLEVLPNRRDPVEDRYDGIRTAIIDEMNEQPLTPTLGKSHSPAQDLVQGKASLKSLLSDDDLKFLLDYEDTPRRWAIGATQRNSNADRFLDSLAIGAWDVDSFVELLANKLSPAGNLGPPNNISDEQVREWVAAKPVEWHQELYALLHTEYLAVAGYRADGYATRLGALRIVRLTDGTYGTAADSFFATDGADPGEGMGQVDELVYSSGRGKAQKENARALLTAIGVREIGEAELAETILKKRYTQEAELPDEKAYRKDLKRFVDLVERQPAKAKMFHEYFVLQGTDLWRTPDQIYLDAPFHETGLSAYYDTLAESEEEPSCVALNAEYLNRGVSVKRLVAFVAAIGVKKSLAIERASCFQNPDAARLVFTAPGNRTRKGIDVDFHIPELDELLPTTNLSLSRVIWKTLREQEDEAWLTARYRNNSNYAPRQGHSQIVCLLRSRAWVPQAGGKFVTPSAATREALPEGFPFDPGWGWLDAIGFGRAIVERSEEEQRQRAIAKQLGFDDDETLNRAKRFAALPPDDQRRVLEELEVRFELPDPGPSNPTRRAERVAARAATAPERKTEDRTRAVSVNRDAVKQEAGQYLRQQYTNADGHMMCQACRKRLPFQLDDGTDYFEKVEFLPSLVRHHPQNYLALCPNHAAMFQHANGSASDLARLVTEMTGNQLDLVLAREPALIYLTKTHLADLQVAIQTEANGEQVSVAAVVASAD